LVELFDVKWMGVRIYDVLTFLNFNTRFSTICNAFLPTNSNTPIHQLELKWRQLHDLFKLVCCIVDVENTLMIVHRWTQVLCGVAKTGGRCQNASPT